MVAMDSLRSPEQLTFVWIVIDEVLLPEGMGVTVGDNTNCGGQDKRI